MKRTRLRSESPKHAAKRQLAKAGARQSAIQRRKELPKSNPERQRKASAKYAKGLAAYKKSETYKIVEKRAGGRCERTTIVAMPGGMGDLEYRCCETEGLEHHHKGYARFGGKELPEDIEVLCPFDHAIEEAKKPAGNRRSRKSAA